MAPIMIKNYYFNSPIRDPTFQKLHNTTSPFIPVPCGRCASCIHLKQIYLVQRVQMESINNDLFYGTLTYNKESLPTVTFGDITFAYPSFSDWQNMIKMIRKDYPELKFRYMLVSEYGHKKHRPHYHFILSLPRTSNLLAVKYSRANELFSIWLRYWRRNYGSRRKPIWKELCTYKRVGGKYNFDLHYLDPNSSKDGLDGVSFYVTKYILKYDDFVDKFKSLLFFQLNHDDFHEAWDLFRPRCLLSKGFGSPDDPDVSAHIIKGINFALANHQAFFPYYISRQTGDIYPLAPYYQKKLLSVDSQLTFISRRPDSVLNEIDIDNFDKRQLQLNQMRAYLSSQSNFIDFEDIDEINSNLIQDAEFFRPNFQDKDFTSDWESF